MKGVILYADDDVLTTRSLENQLFSRFQADDDFTVIPISTIDDLEQVILSSSTYKALILDWSFKIKSEDDGIPERNENPKDLLMKYPLYSHVYIFSRENIPEETQLEIKRRFSEGKVQFKLKDVKQTPKEQYESIKKDICDFESTNSHMEIPIRWSQAINQSVQSIFYDFEKANANWLADIKSSSDIDEADATSEIIDLFQNILGELLIQNSNLRNAIDSYDVTPSDNSQYEDIACLYRRIIYTKLHDSSPIMTGDIYKFSDSEYGIVITPECEIRGRKETNLDFLCFEKNDCIEYLTNHDWQSNNWYDRQREKTKDQYRKLFNNGEQALHFLPSFPFDDEHHNISALINFKSALKIKNKGEFDGKRFGYKLNSPYIQQLRQRFVSFFCKFGVPNIPNPIRDYNLKR